MDCPNTIMGGTNGVRIKKGNDPVGIAKDVEKKSKDTESVTVGRDTCTISRASSLGIINYCICWIGK
jgi:hypothetical protein